MTTEIKVTREGSCLFVALAKYVGPEVFQSFRDACRKAGLSWVSTKSANAGPLFRESEILAGMRTAGFEVASSNDAVTPTTLYRLNAPRRAVTAQEEWAAAGIIRVAGMDPDRAREQNGVGFSAYDGEFGHDMATKLVERDGKLTEGQWKAVLRLANKYRKQIGPFVPTSTDPEITTTGSN